jgi:hypothetical protein
LFILNELDGDIFSRSVIQGLPLPPPSGWRPYPGDAALSSEKLGICFWPADTTVSGGSWRLFWGRERNSSLRWAGFILMIDPLPENKSIECSYVVRFGKNVGSEA